MKKIAALLLAVILALSSVGCTAGTTPAVAAPKSVLSNLQPSLERYILALGGSPTKEQAAELSSIVSDDSALLNTTLTATSTEQKSDTDELSKLNNTLHQYTSLIDQYEAAIDQVAANKAVYDPVITAFRALSRLNFATYSKEDSALFTAAKNTYNALSETQKQTADAYSVFSFGPGLLTVSIKDVLDAYQDVIDNETTLKPIFQELNQFTYMGLCGFMGADYMNFSYSQKHYNALPEKAKAAIDRYYLLTTGTSLKKVLPALDTVIGNTSFSDFVSDFHDLYFLSPGELADQYDFQLPSLVKAAVSRWHTNFSTGQLNDINNYLISTYHVNYAAMLDIYSGLAENLTVLQPLLADMDHAINSTSTLNTRHYLNSYHKLPAEAKAALDGYCRLKYAASPELILSSDKKTFKNIAILEKALFDYHAIKNYNFLVTDQLPTTPATVLASEAGAEYNALSPELKDVFNRYPVTVPFESISDELDTYSVLAQNTPAMSLLYDHPAMSLLYDHFDQIYYSDILDSKSDDAAVYEIYMKTYDELPSKQKTALNKYFRSINSISLETLRQNNKLILQNPSIYQTAAENLEAVYWNIESDPVKYLPQLTAAEKSYNALTKEQQAVFCDYVFRKNRWVDEGNSQMVDTAGFFHFVPAFAAHLKELKPLIAMPSRVDVFSLRDVDQIDSPLFLNYLSTYQALSPDAKAAFNDFVNFYHFYDTPVVDQILKYKPVFQNIDTLRPALMSFYGFYYNTDSANILPFNQPKELIQMAKNNYTALSPDMRKIFDDAVFSSEEVLPIEVFDTYLAAADHIADIEPLYNALGRLDNLQNGENPILADFKNAVNATRVYYNSLSPESKKAVDDFWKLDRNTTINDQLASYEDTLKYYTPDLTLPTTVVGDIFQPSTDPAAVVPDDTKTTTPLQKAVNILLSLFGCLVVIYPVMNIRKKEQ